MRLSVRRDGMGVRGQGGMHELSDAGVFACVVCVSGSTGYNGGIRADACAGSDTDAGAHGALAPVVCAQRPLWQSIHDQSNLDKVKARLLETGNRAGECEPGGKLVTLPSPERLPLWFREGYP